MFDLPYKSIPGVMSEIALAQHVELWREYETRAKTGSDSYDVAGALLHRLFFSQLTDKPSGPGVKFEALIATRWDNIKAWWTAMRTASMEARGWAITAIRGDDLRIFELDAHDVGGVIGYEPLVVIDLYSHGFFMDYGTRRDLYVDALIKAFDWAEIERRVNFRECGENSTP